MAKSDARTGANGWTSRQNLFSCRLRAATHLLIGMKSTRKSSIRLRILRSIEMKERVNFLQPLAVIEKIN